MSLAFLCVALTAAAPHPAVEAERNFAADAQTRGQWTAFRAYAAPDAIMFLPQPTRIHDWLKGKPDPQVAYMWWPAEAYVSCDGTIAVTTGPSVRGAYRGYFTTIWQRQPDGSWKWVLDHGEAVGKPRQARQSTYVRYASCTQPERTIQGFLPEPDKQGSGASPDRTLQWQWTYNVKRNARFLGVGLWTGAGYEAVIQERVTDSE